MLLRKVTVESQFHYYNMYTTCVCVLVTVAYTVAHAACNWKCVFYKWLQIKDKHLRYQCTEAMVTLQNFGLCELQLFGGGGPRNYFHFFV